MPHFAAAVINPELEPERFGSVEATIEFLENTPAETLIVMVDDYPDDFVRLMSYLLVEAGWEGESQIGLIKLVSERPGFVADAVTELQKYYEATWSSPEDVSN
jgi:hypothetical protein